MLDEAENDESFDTSIRLVLKAFHWLEKKNLKTLLNLQEYQQNLIMLYPAVTM